MSSKTMTMSVTEDTQPTRGGDIVHAGTYRLSVPADYDASEVTPADLLGDTNIVDLGAYPMVVVNDISPSFGDVARITNDEDVWTDLEDFGDEAKVYELGESEVAEGQRVRLTLLGDEASL